MQCYLINAYVTHKAITPIRALGRLKFQRSSLWRVSMTKGWNSSLSINNWQGPRKSNQQPENRTGFASVHESRSESHNPDHEMSALGTSGNTMSLLSWHFPLFPWSSALSRAVAGLRGRWWSSGRKMSCSLEIVGGWGALGTSLGIPAGFAGTQQGNQGFPSTEWLCPLHHCTIAIQF